MDVQVAEQGAAGRAVIGAGFALLGALEWRRGLALRYGGLRAQH
jgi:hypothetical protein